MTWNRYKPLIYEKTVVRSSIYKAMIHLRYQSSLDIFFHLDCWLFPWWYPRLSKSNRFHFYQHHYCHYYHHHILAQRPSRSCHASIFYCCSISVCPRWRFWYLSNDFDILAILIIIIIIMIGSIFLGLEFENVLLHTIPFWILIFVVVPFLIIVLFHTRRSWLHPWLKLP